MQLKSNLPLATNATVTTTRARSLARFRLRNSGTSMIEVLVATLVTSVGMLAMAGLMGVGLRYSRTSEFRSEANLLVGDIADRMRANAVGIDSYGYAPTALATSAPTAVSACVVATACTPAELAAIDLQTWRRTLFTHLPSGTGFIQITDSNGGMADVWVMWTDPTALSGGSTDTWGYYMNAGTEGRTCPPGFNNMNPLPRCLFFRVGI